ncbi:MEIOTIC F-BOX protein MOF-like isoform X1 [Hordeum vulgare subsp. vulgare]|uniref:F-box domain-containing protein n=1 Tax=Hordeum vulgare subsp. vulgare TaxID=112509 RepID=A0A8I6WXI3_HORVV|nr:MEIOTIC F-BOX protein MOF-like isoform X1 [Hordeum vulgare subsp. vulgare]
MSAPTSIPCGSKSARCSRNGVDRLSSLPDDLLHHVMSFLPMPEVVRTSLLSPRWRFVWRSTPFIRIDGAEFMDKSKLENFVDCLLLLHDYTASLDKARISLHCIDHTKCSVWIRHAIMHKVRVLHISGPLSLDKTAIFPSQHLKTIRLQSAILRHGLFRPLNYDCPVLEHLELELCNFCDNEEISSTSLKVLHISQCYLTTSLLICARNLTHLSILDPYIGDIVTKDLSSLVTASISLISCSYYKDTVVMDHHLLDGLSHATTLELHAPLNERAFESDLPTWPMFSNLTSLVVGNWVMTADFHPLHGILQRSDKLKELTVKLKMEEWSSCKALPSTSIGMPLGSGSYPCIQRIKIYCRKDHPRVGELVQALVPTACNAKISIERP